MIVTPERVIDQPYAKPHLLGAIAISETLEDLPVRERAATFIGSCIASSEVHDKEVEQLSPIESLYDAIQKAAEGDQTARKVVEVNARTDVIERTIKSGHVIKVQLEADQAGRIQQFGQSMESVQANSLRYASRKSQMLARTKAETTNAFRIEEYFKAGKLEDYSFVVFSRAADDMSLEEMDGAGFFTETMSCAIQVTSANGNVISTESAFVAGVRQPGEARHDAQTIVALGEKLGIDFSGKSAAEIINTPMLIPNSLIENGVIDLVAMYDDCAGGTFFGETREWQDYIVYLEECKERERTLQPKVEDIVDELIAAAPRMHSRVEAAQVLNKISGAHMIQQAVFDLSIDARVFGKKSYEDIMAARMHFERGDHEAGLAATNKAIENDGSKSCPGGPGSASEESNEQNPAARKSDEPCEFVSKKCPRCGTKNVKTTVTTKEIKGACGCVVSK